MTPHGAFLLAVRLLLAAVFFVASIGKLRDRPASRQALRDFGVPDGLSKPLAVALPITELAIALALIPEVTVYEGAWAAIALLAIFTVAVTVNVLVDRRPNCQCFGTLHAAPIGWHTVVRNIALAAGAAALVWPGQYLPGMLTVLLNLPTTWRITVGVSSLAAVLGCAILWLFLHLLEQNGRLLLRIEALEARSATVGSPSASQPPPAPAAAAHGLVMGTIAPGFVLESAAGTYVSLDQLLEPRLPVLVLFADSSCGPCRSLFPDLASWQRTYADRLTVAILTRGDPATVRIEGVHSARILLQREREVADAYRCPGTPGAVLVDSSGRIDSQLATGADEVRALVAAVVSSRHASHIAPVPRTLHVGDAVPPLALTDLAGNEVALGELRGSRTLVVFWNPTCHFCTEMLPHLATFERDLERDAQIVVISRGSIEENAALRFRSLVLLDQEFAAGRAFGARGTPSAVILAGNGCVASGIVAGAEAIFALALESLLIKEAANIVVRTGGAARGAHVAATETVVLRQNQIVRPS